MLLLSESEAVGRLKTLESRLPGTDESCFRLHKFFYVPNYQVTHAPGGARLQSCENQLPATTFQRGMSIYIHPTSCDVYAQYQFKCEMY